MRNAVGLRKLPLLLFAIGLVHSPAATLYVSTQGSDGNPGTSAQPFQTITGAYSSAKAGDTILVRPGVYTDYSTGWGLHLGNSGTASSPIVLRSEIQGGAVLDGQNAADRNVGIYIDGNYNVVDGFEIRNGTKGGITIWANGNQILNCNIHNNGNPPSTSTEGKDGIYSSEGTAGNMYIANYVHHNGRSGSNLDHGLYLCGQNELVINNVLLANSACGLQIAGYTTVSNLKVYNNVMALNGTDGIILWQALNAIDIQNNIFYQNGHYAIGSYDAHGSGINVDKNLSFGNGYGDFNFSDGGSDYSYNLGTTIYLDPHFANNSASSFDAHLGPGSPALHAAANLSSLFATDMAGTTRPGSGSWDLGAYASSVSDSLSISMVTPLNGETISGMMVISAQASANADVARVQFKCDGADLGDSLTTAPFAVNVDSRTLSNGYHALSALAWDADGHQTSATAINILIANLTTPPVLSPLRKVPEGLNLTWTSIPGKTYRVAYKNNMSAVWTDLSSSITATGSATSWTDASAGDAQQRFYTVYAVN